MPNRNIETGRFIERLAPDSQKFLRLLRIMGIMPQWMRYDKTQHGWHVIIKPTKPLRRWEIITTQAICGSDAKREAYNIQRLKNGIWLNQLFEGAKK